VWVFPVVFLFWLPIWVAEVPTNVAFAHRTLVY
jgi:hypothetical protein